jgi:hypothetical protein
MVAIHIDLPIFIGDTTAFGYFSGDVELTTLPAEGVPFPWPETWLTQHQALFAKHGNQVWGTSKWPYPPVDTLVTMYGIHCTDEAEARSLVAHIESVTGFLFSEHDWDALAQR